MDRIDAINRIHPGILSHKKTVHESEEPSPAWLVVFDGWAKETTEANVRSYTFPSTNLPYAARAMSYKEHMVRKTKCYLEFQPSDCHPSKTKPGTMQDVLSYMVYPHARTREYENDPQPFTTNEVERKHPRFHKYSGMLFMMPSGLQGVVVRVLDMLLPNGLLEKLKQCRPDEFVSLLNENRTHSIHLIRGRAEATTARLSTSWTRNSRNLVEPTTAAPPGLHTTSGQRSTILGAIVTQWLIGMRLKGCLRFSMQTSGSENWGTLTRTATM